MDTGRQHDLIELRHEYNRATSDSQRQKISEAARKIANESSYVRSMRESLIRETRRGNFDNAKDIKEDFVKNSGRYNI